MKHTAHLIITLALLAATASVQAQDLLWAVRAGGSDRDWGLGIAALADGSALVSGAFSGTATFGPGEPGETLLTSAGDTDIFVARHNADGTLAWARWAGGRRTPC